MLSTDAFNYVNVLDKAADASWSRENILTNNIANVNTPGYKRKDLNFENTLKTELGRCKHESLDSKMKDVDLSRLNPSAHTFCQFFIQFFCCFPYQCFHIMPHLVR